VNALTSSSTKATIAWVSTMVERVTGRKKMVADGSGGARLTP
jgi:hypothetical protein